MTEDFGKFENQRDLSDGEADMASAQLVPVLQQASSQPGLVAALDGGNVVVLNANQVIESLETDGRDLVIILTDGTRIVVPDGAIVIPQIIVDGVPIPPANVAALLVGSEPEPAAGDNASSGGNFATDPGEIQSAFDLGDLLPYSELPLGQILEEEVIPVPVDLEPSVVIVTANDPLGSINATAGVSEAGLPARGTEPAGTQAASNSETTTGSILFDPGNALDAISINGVEVTTVGQVITGQYGTLTIASIDLVAGEIGFVYQLVDNRLGAGFDSFEVAVIDTDGDVALASLRVDIAEDGPIAANDVNQVPAGQHAGIIGNVLTNDNPGADNFALAGGVRGFSNQSGSANPGATLQGVYGTLTLNADGSYVYVRDLNTPGGVQESFSYQVIDQDGNTASAVLTVLIENSPNQFTSVPVVGEGSEVDEAGLPPRTDNPAGSGEIADNVPGNDSDTSEATVGTVTFNSPDGIAQIAINGVVINTGNLPQTVFSDERGTLVITSVVYDPVSNDGAFVYEFTLADNTSGDDTSVSFDLSLVDLDGDTATETIVIRIIDDAPLANADVDSVAEDGPVTADGNVLSGVGGTDANATDGVADVRGADGAAVTAVAFGTAAGTLGSPLAGAYGTLTLNADGSYSYALNNSSQFVQGLSAGQSLTEVFNYTLTDGDGDQATTTLTITINGADDGVVINGLGVADGEEVVNENDLADGSSPDAAALTQTGTFSVESPDGLATVSVGGVTVVSGGVFVPGQSVNTPAGLLTITGFTPVIGADGSVIGGTISYSYLLQDNTLAHGVAGADSVFESLPVVVTDTDGSTSNGSLDVRIIDDVPVAVADTNSLVEGGVVTGNVLSDGTDDVFGADGPNVVGAGVIGVRAAGGDTTTAVTTGTGTVINGLYGTLTLNADGSYSYDSAPNTTVPATDVFVYTIEDGDGDRSTTTLTITVNPTTLAANNDDEVLVNEAALASGSNPGSTAETDGDNTLVGSVTGGTGPYTYALVGTGAGTYGTLTLQADGSYSYTLTAPFTTTPDTNNGTNTEQNRESFTYEATDSNGNTVQGTIFVDIIDDVPVAVADTNSLVEGGVVTGNVLSDGTDDVFGADGPNVVGAGVIGVRAAGGDTTTAVTTGTGTVINGLYGTLTLNADGSYSYDSAPNTTVPATDVFVYTIEDGDGDRSTTTLTITVNPTTLAANNDDEVLVNEAALASGSNPGSTAETDGDNTLVGSVTGGTGPYTYALVGTGAGTYGTLTLQADGSYSYTLTAPFTTTPDTNNGTNTEQNRESFTYEATDSNGNTVQGTIFVDIIDDVPVAVADTNSLVEGGVVTGNVLSDGTDDVFGADGPNVVGAGVIGVRAAGGDTTTAVTTGTGTVINGLYGTLTLNADGSYSYDTAPNTITTVVADVFVYTIEDGDGDRSTTTLTITVNPSTLAANNDDEVLVNEAALASGSNPGSTAETDGDNTLVGSVTGGTGPYTYALVGTGAGTYGTLTLQADGSYSYTLTAPFTTTPDTNNGTNTEQNRESFTYEATDSNGNTVQGTIFVDIIDDVPSAVADGSVAMPIAVAEDTATSINVFANDTAGADDVNLATGVVLATGATNGVVAYTGGGNFSYTPNAGFAGADSFTYTITDADGDSSTATVYVNVGADSKPVPNAAVAAVDDDGLADANPAGAGDLNADTGDSGAGLGDESVFVGTFTANFGNDGPGTFTLEGMGGTSGTVGTETVNYSWNGTTNTLTATGPRGVLFTVAVEPSTGRYTVTLVDNVRHVDDGTDTENDATAQITFTAIDSEGDETDAILTITFDDDVPSAVADGSVAMPIAVAEDTATSINVFANDTAGADDVNLATGVVLATGATNGVVAYTGGGNFSYTPNAGFAGADSFTYTITDADGDSSTATVYVNVGADSKPVPNAAVAAVDDDGLADANPAGAGDLNADTGDSGAGLGDESVFVGTFTANFGNDGPGTFTLEGMGGTSGTVGTETVNYSWNGTTNTLTATGPRGVLFTVAVEPSTGRYTVTLVDNVRHVDDGTDTENDATAQITFTAIDSEGDETDAILTITFDDDVPSAVADGSVAMPIAVAEDTATSINVFANDTAGADDVNLATGVVLATGATNGVVAYTGGGNFSYTPNAGFAGADSFTYTITDADGDSSTATVYVNVGADSKPVPNAAVAAVDDDGLADANPAGAGDLNADTGDSGAGLGDESVFVGTFTANFGNDGPGTFTLEGMGGTSGTVGTETVNYSWNGTTNTLTATGPRGVLFTVAVEPSTGRYTVTLVDNVRHVDDGTDTENDATAQITFTAIDSEGDETDAILTITFDDDVPSAVGNGQLASVDDNATGVIIGTVAGIIGNDTYGADGPSASSAISIATGSLGGTVSIVSGNLVYTSATNITSPYNPVVETFTYTITDADGDTATATFSVQLTDTGPTGGTVIAKVDDDGLASGNGANSTTDDLDANLGDSGAGLGNDAVWVGTLAGNFGTDSSGGRFTFANLNGTTASAGTGSFAETLTYSWNTSNNTLTATSNLRGAVFTVEITNVTTGAYKVTLLQNFLQNGGNDDELAVGVDSLPLLYTVRDGEGEGTTGTLTIQFGDDAPLAFTPQSKIIQDGPTDTSVTGTLGLSIGADSPATLSFNIANGTAVIDQNTGAPVTVGGVALKYYLDPNTGNLVATTGTAWNNGTVGFNVTLNPSGTGSYQFNIFEDLSNGTTTSFTNLTSSAAGNVDYRVIGLNAGGASATDVLLSAVNSSGTRITVNTDSNSIGAGNQSIGPNETVRFDFINNITTDTTAPISPTELNWGAQLDTTNFKQTIAQVQGNETETVGINVYAIDSTLSSGVAPDTNPAGGFSDGLTQVIKQVTVTKFDDATPATPTVAFDLTGLTNGQSVTSGGITVTFRDVGGVTWVTIAGLQERDVYSISTGADTFNAVAVRVLSNAGQSWTADDLDLGVFSVGSFNAGEDIELSFGVTATDEDGDTASGTINVAVDQDGSSVTPPIALDLDGDGEVSFLSLDAGVSYDYDGDGIATQTAWVASEDGLLARQTEDGRHDIVFTDDAPGAVTDLDGLAKAYDSNGDGQFTAVDQAFDSFGVWQDANSNGVVDAGEFTSLADAGITAINLTSDGVGYSAANGDVTVYGTGSFTFNGSSGVLVDAAFALGGRVAANDASSNVRAEQRLADGAIASSALAGFLALMPVLAEMPFNPDLFDVTAPRVNLGPNNYTEAFVMAEIADFQGVQNAAFFEKHASGTGVELNGNAATFDGTGYELRNPFEQTDDVRETISGEQAMADYAQEPMALSFAMMDLSAHSAMDALLSLGDGTASGPGGIINPEFAHQTVADALAGSVIDALLDQVASEGAYAGPAPVAIEPNQLAGLLAADISSQAMSMGALVNQFSVDDQAQMLVSHS